MRSWVKSGVFTISRYGGLYRVASRLTRQKLRIICFHGMSIQDEHEFRPGMFITADKFRRRLSSISNRSCNVLPLADAIRGLKDGTLPDLSTVITFDDGFYSCYQQAVPILHEFGYPATFYVTTYYVDHNSPVFRLAVQYLFWKSRRKTFEIGTLSTSWRTRLNLHNCSTVDEMMWEIITRAESELTEEERQLLCHDLGCALDVNYEDVKNKRIFSLFRPDEIAKLASQGFDIQLHTHRHLFPLDEVAASREIVDNRQYLHKITDSMAEHFCYPSGVWSKQHWQILENENIASATTCEPGLNSKSTSVYGLRRILETESMSELVFDSEIAGFADLLRSAVRRKYTTPTPSSSYGR